tara:strand:- start:49770 stop:50132 length:363 start_codon:yes stop_codon:yes gene_type:complete
MRRASIQFFQGIEEIVIPEIRLSKSKNGNTGQAVFTFKNPSVLISENFKEINGMYLLDEEGTITVKEINVAVSKKNGKYTALQAIYTWNSKQGFERIMRFANRYAQEKGLQYQEKKYLST